MRVYVCLIFFLYKTFALIINIARIHKLIAGKLNKGVYPITIYKNKGVTSDLKELMECAVSALWGK